MVTSWILNSLSKDLADSLQYVNDAKELWKELEDSCQCVWGAKANMQKAEQDRRLIQFLMGLNEVYTVVRGSILMMNPLPSIAQAFSILIQEEKQREVKSQNQVMVDSTSLNANTTGVNTFRKNYCQNSAGTGGFRENYNPNRPRPFCEYCKRPGYTKDKCYKLHGYPQGMNRPNNNSQAFNKFNRGKVNVADASDRVNTGEREEGMLQERRRNLHRENTGNANLAGGAVSFACTVTCCNSFEHGDHSYDCFEPNTDSWILHSGARNYMTFKRSLLTNTKTLVYPFLVTLPNGYKVKVTLIGDVVPSPKFTLRKAPSVKRPLEIGKAIDGLYFQFSKSMSSTTCNSVSCSSTSHHTHVNRVPSHSQTAVHSPELNKGSGDSVLNVFVNGVDTVDSLWHNRLGHVPFVKMREATLRFCRDIHLAQRLQVLSLVTRKIHVSRDVVFHENVFPFHLSFNFNDISSPGKFPSAQGRFPNAPVFPSESDVPHESSIAVSPESHHGAMSPQHNHDQSSPISLHQSGNIETELAPSNQD
ncbi:PREDICTED: uncharacterized protein LOC109213927 [Nicotiana attenuata]|uniref:uncharacterized protein LOC109213927 n=1 Tax=Nicotiana attenuata TaxID=49451 RepID=UPI000904EBBE|nr:PREDICTED: uncharacterized protein LOC109213927 [Nicotiana attenuata]